VTAACETDGVTDALAFEDLAAEFDGDGISWSVCAVDLSDGTELVAVHSDRMLSAASIGKVLLLMETARAIDAGELSPDEPLTRELADAVADSGIWQHLSVDTLPLDDVARLVGLASDNWATNTLLRRVGGIEVVARSASALGIRDVLLHDRVRDMRTPDHPTRLSEASATGLVSLFTRLVRDEDLGHGVGERVLGWLTGGLDLGMVAAAFGLDPLAHATPDRGVTVVNKTGTDLGVRADAGWVVGPAGQVVYACIANWDAAFDGPDPLRDDVLRAMHRLGAALRARVLS